MRSPFIYANTSQKTQQPILNSIYRDATESFRGILSPEKLVQPKVPPRILVVDDDPTFVRIMRRAAEQKGAIVTCCQSIDEFAGLKKWDHDAVIMDYDLGAVTGFELTTYLEHFTKETIPVVLVSQSNRSDSSRWPSSIREFVHKGLGPFAILDAAFEAYDITCIHKQIDKRRSNRK